MSNSELTEADCIRWLDTTAPEALQELYQQAYAIKQAHVGTKVFYRGIIEFSNVCEKDCFYCGIRRSNKSVKRYVVQDDDVVAAATWAWEQNYGSIVLQSGERKDDAFASQIEKLLQRISEATNGELGVTLSLGEQSPDVLERWRNVGGKRYLLRIETTNPKLYSTLHPDDHHFEDRLQCLRDLRDLDYQVGTGVMIGLPGQTSEDLANDIQFFKDHDIDMIGMGPYIPHGETPMGNSLPDFDSARQLQRGLTMLALTRIALRDVNIAATTALQALDPQGRERGLEAGANIIMPNLTDTKYREGYQLYDGKPCLDENAGMCRFCLEGRIASVGESVGYGEHGDSPHYLKRVAQQT
ncbi:MAG: [FeFe] hydrogenase H-cluster radical SAM maturase HydE [Verrucomicrobia bacterium]|nr:[FeFe] hydrogenase H-cluster radical SAM maturase HydE [Verrucomicrobiota bacterium]